MLLQIPAVLHADELTAIHQHIKQARWVDGRMSAGMQAVGVKQNSQIAEGDPELNSIRRIVLQALQRDPLFFAAALPERILPPFVNRFQDVGNHYGFHVDSAIRNLPDGSGRMRTDISATLFLTPPDDYDGGELVIQDMFGEQRIKGAAGSLVLYPSSSVHAVLPVISGERLACFMFIESMVRDAAQRRMLFEMDMALIKLRQQIGETAEMVQLTGVYHNLLRAWVS